MPDQNKPIVKYHDGFVHDIPAEGATLFGVVDHPRLGACPVVHTSSVVSYDKTTGRIETRNTIYEKV